MGAPDSGRGLDPDDWAAFKAAGYRMLDDMVEYLAQVRARPVWQRMPDELREAVREPLPRGEGSLEAVYEQFRERILPYATGNTHPRFMGWVHGGGNPVGMLAELLAAGLNANLGGRDHAPVEIERQVIRWAAEIVGFPEDASGILVTGCSLANFIGVLVARQAKLGPEVRRSGVGDAKLAAYTARSAHSCVSRAMEMAGLGSAALRLLPTDGVGRLSLAALEETIVRDRCDGVEPFLIVATAGSVDIGAIDDLQAAAAIARREGFWLHVDGAIGGLASLAPALRNRFAGIELADSVALDFHKWGQVPYDAGCVLVRDASLHRATFASPAAYLSRDVRGLAAGDPWLCDFGPDLSRGFRALKIWMTLKTYGADLIGEQIQRCCDLAQALAERVDAEPELERLAAVALNIVCFRFRAGTGDLDRLNRDIVVDLQESGVAAPSTTTIDKRLAIRAALVNHRIRLEDVHALVDGVLERGRALTQPGTGAAEHDTRENEPQNKPSR